MTRCHRKTPHTWVQSLHRAALGEMEDQNTVSYAVLVNMFEKTLLLHSAPQTDFITPHDKVRPCQVCENNFQCPDVVFLLLWLSLLWAASLTYFPLAQARLSQGPNNQPSIRNQSDSQYLRLRWWVKGQLWAPMDATLPLLRHMERRMAKKSIKAEVYKAGIQKLEDTDYMLGCSFVSTRWPSLAA